MPMNVPLKRLSTIDQSLILDGSISYSGELIVEGTIKGLLKGEHIIVAESGQVFAETHVSDMTISGIFNGSLTVTNKLVLLSGGRCSGRIICRELEMEAGSLLNGEIQCSPT